MMGIQYGLGALSKYLGSGPSKFQKKMRAGFDDVSSQLRRGITSGDIQGMIPRLRAAALPGVNRMVGRSAARFGGSAGATATTGINAMTEATAGPLAQLQSQAMLDKQQSLRHLLSLMGNLSR